MKRLFLGLVLVLGFAQFNDLGAQVVQQEQLSLGSITNMPTRVATVQGYVLPMTVSLADSTWTPMNFIHYNGGSIYMQITVINWSTSTKSFKLEYDLRYGDGAGYYFYRSSNSIPGGSSKIYRIGVTGYAAKLGLITLTGRVYGTGMGNENKVTTQALVF